MTTAKHALERSQPPLAKTLPSVPHPPVSGRRASTGGVVAPPADEERELSMQRVGEYQVGRMVGEGGMGKVYEAEERLSKRRVALKVLRPELSRSQEARRLFLNEMSILSHIDHPNIVRCLACTEADDQLVMVLEYLKGRTLRERIAEDGALAWDDAVRTALQIARALGAAHRQEPKVVHRDLKPENVMMLEDGTVKVMDFGIAKVLEAVSGATTHSAGTLQYMSPEQIDASNVDERTDLYALGLVLYEMLNGRPPFESASPRELLNLQCTARPAALPEAVRKTLPRGIEQLVFRLLEKAPEDRPQAAEEVCLELERFAPSNDLPPDTVSEGPPVPTGGEGTASRPASAPGGTMTPASGAVSASSVKERATVHDTALLVEKVAGVREVSVRTALAVVLGLSLLAGAVTYALRAGEAPPDDTLIEVPGDLR